MLDPKTLVAVLVLLGVILALCTVGLRRTLPVSIGGLYPWAFALFGFATAAALVFLVALDRLSSSWLPPAGLVYVASAVALAVSIRLFIGRSARWQRIVSLYVLLAIPAPLSLWIEMPSGWAQLWLMTVMLACSLVSLEALIRSAEAREALGGRLLLFGFTAMAGSALLRIFWLFSEPPPTGWLAMQQTLRGQLFLMFASAALLIGSIGLMLLATDRLRRMLEHLASHDALTGLLERNGFRGPAEHSLTLAQRRGEPVACLLCDIDHFKQVNDAHGHPAGDAALVLIADLLGDSVRASDLVSRFGGEEFTLLLPNCDERAARLFAERVRQKVQSTALKYQGQSIALTISIGVAVGRGEQLVLEPLYRRADRALYAAKHGGRNRSALAPPESNNVAQTSILTTDSSGCSA